MWHDAGESLLCRRSLVKWFLCAFSLHAPRSFLWTELILFHVFRTYETSLLVDEAISEELPYSGKLEFRFFLISVAKIYVTSAEELTLLFCADQR